MTEENKPKKAKSNIKWVRPPEGVFEAYSNQTHLSWSLDDIRLRFAQIGLSDESLTPGDAFVSVNIEKAAITLSWRNAKILHDQLAQIIGNYEKENGEINLKPKLAPNDGT
jgi:uncharacterized protein DUF3467